MDAPANPVDDTWCWNIRNRHDEFPRCSQDIPSASRALPEACQPHLSYARPGCDVLSDHEELFMHRSGLGFDRRQFLRAGATVAAISAMPGVSAAAEPIRIGFGMSLTGPNAGAGKMFLLGREVWRDEINAKGGLIG